MIWPVLTRVETEESSYKILGLCVCWNCFRGWGRPLKLYVLSWGFVLGGSNAEKWDDHQKKKFFISNSVEALIQFKEEH